VPHGVTSEEGDFFTTVVFLQKAGVEKRVSSQLVVKHGTATDVGV
jgi:hypothetical protein